MTTSESLLLYVFLNFAGLNHELLSRIISYRVSVEDVETQFNHYRNLVEHCCSGDSTGRMEDFIVDACCVDGPYTQEYYVYITSSFLLLKSARVRVRILDFSFSFVLAFFSNHEVNFSFLFFAAHGVFDAVLEARGTYCGQLCSG